MLLTPEETQKEFVTSSQP